jgi:N-sulfoglucosamine sulfohydrolase
LTDEELATASEQTRAGYARWLNPPEVQLYDLQDDPHEWRDLADDPAHAETKVRLLRALEEWQATTGDPIRYPEKLRMLMEETDAVAATERRSPEGGWRYLEYFRGE